MSKNIINQQRSVKENINQNKESNLPLRVTILTLFGYSVGLLLIWNIKYSIGIFLLSLLVTYGLCGKNYFFQSPKTITSFIITTYAFGLIHAFTFGRVSQFLNLTSVKSSLNSQIYHLISIQPSKQLPLLQIYISFLCVYYYFQFQLNNTFHHTKLDWYSFLIYHSRPYMIANMFSMIEHVLTMHIFGFQYKKYHFFVYPALVLMIFGEGLRVCAFFTAKSNFTHLVRYKRHPEHQLITHGVYSFFRHPSYTGYFYFAVASQIFIGNWISAVGFCVALIKFFSDRIHDEERMLAKFFEKYLYYKKHTHILIPFVKDPDSQDILKFLISGGKWQQ